jgi:ribosomal protein L24
MEEYFEYEDKVKIKKGYFKGKYGIVQQIMPNGAIGVKLSNRSYIYFKAEDLEKEN